LCNNNTQQLHTYILPTSPSLSNFVYDSSLPKPISDCHKKQTKRCIRYHHNDEINMCKQLTISAQLKRTTF